MKAVLAVIGAAVVILHFTNTGTLDGKVCFDDTCVGTMNGGVHLGDRAQWGAKVPLRTQNG